MSTIHVQYDYTSKPPNLTAQHACVYEWWFLFIGIILKSFDIDWYDEMPPRSDDPGIIVNIMIIVILIFKIH